VKHNGIHAAARDLRILFESGSLGGLSDGQLLARFVARREGVVFEAIMVRHGPMVWGVCRRVLRDHHDAEDAFQATFLVLARRAPSIQAREKLANWLYGVAYQTATKSRATRAKRRGREGQVSDGLEIEVPRGDKQDDLLSLLDQEVGRLPGKYRLPVVLCELEGKTHREAAEQLGWPIGTVSGRLSRARAILARRLSRPGLALSAGSLAWLLSLESASAGVPAELIGPTARAACLMAAGQTASAGMVSAEAVALTGEVLKTMMLSKIKIAGAVLLVGVAFAAGEAGLAYQTRAADGQARGKAGEAARGSNRRPFEDRFGVRLSSAARLRAEPEEPNADDDRGRESRRDRAEAREDRAEESETPIKLADLIGDADPTPEQLEFAKSLIEALMETDQAAEDKTPEELDEMVKEGIKEIEGHRLEIRVLEAKVRRLKKIKGDRAKAQDKEEKPR
jgi:RNA polymerase sigma factor (sigma-70 family)